MRAMLVLLAVAALPMNAASGGVRPGTPRPMDVASVHDESHVLVTQRPRPMIKRSSTLLHSGVRCDLLRMRGGATVGPLRLGPLVLDVRVGPRLCVFLNAFAGLIYSISLVGLDPLIPDPTKKYWQNEQTTTTIAILQYFALALVWINLAMVYAMTHLNAPASGLLKFQSFGWLSILALLCFQVNRYGFHAQQDTLGVMFTLLFLSSYLGFMP